MFVDIGLRELFIICYRLVLFFMLYIGFVGRVGCVVISFFFLEKVFVIDLELEI